MPVPIHIEGVSKRFGRQTVLDRVDLKIEPGELFFLLGPSGCGKTTLLRCLAGFCEPDEGRIAVNGRDITAMPPHLRDMGMVFQNYALWPHMTLKENVSFGLEMRHVGKTEIDRRVMAALEMVRLADRADSKPNQLSGGQQQRIALARALVIQPQGLLLDEPLSNLDAKLRLEMRGEIRRICKEAGLTALYVTHDQKEALSIADRLAVMEAGVIRQIGRPQEVYLQPVSRFVAQFIGETTFLKGTALSSANGVLRVDTAVGEWQSTVGGPECTPGEEVWLSLRPEVIRLHGAPTSGPNVFSAKLHSTVYLGEMAQHQVDLAGADGAAVTLKAFELHPKIVARDWEAPVRIHVDPADVLVLRE
ncbi:MAG TPA: spermidine/putrescine ABC transporter ATP-binding protein [Verrucomicrobia bacterium]|nr:spermidine/putrescine ABC transporter ATP-binding protein [Verrucomicrobiota bacterium]